MNSRRRPQRDKHEAGAPNTDASTTIFFTVEEVADLLRTTSTAVYAMKARGHLPGLTMIGRRLLFDRRVVLDWLARKAALSALELP